MIFDQILFHNVEELEEMEKGYLLRRVCKKVRDGISDGVQNNRFATGVELRFRMTDGAVDLTLSSELVAESATVHIFFGSFQGGGEYSSKNVGPGNTTIHIEYPTGMEKLRQLAEEYHLPYDPEVVRVVMPYTPCYYVGVKGKVEPPRSGDLPEKTYLAYGSSITHGSLGLIQPDSYAFRIAQQLGTDYLNLGFAGCALMEEEMAEYLISRKDWDFASVEMGINAVGEKRRLELAEFERRIDRFTQILAADPRPVFATSIFVFNGEDAEQELAEKMRRIVRRYAAERLIFTDGLQLLGDPTLISADCTHPSVRGIEQIAVRWGHIMQETLQMTDF